MRELYIGALATRRDLPYKQSDNSERKSWACVLSRNLCWTSTLPPFTVTHMSLCALGCCREWLVRDLEFRPGHWLSGGSGANIMLLDDRCELPVLVCKSYILLHVPSASGAHPFLWQLSNGCDLEDWTVQTALLPRGLCGAQHKKHRTAQFLLTKSF